MKGFAFFNLPVLEKLNSVLSEAIISSSGNNAGMETEDALVGNLFYLPWQYDFK